MKKLQFLLILFVATAFTYPAKDIKLEYNFKVGDQFTWTQTSHQAIKQSIPGMGDVNVDVNVSGTMKLKVAELTPTGAKMEVQYQQLKMATKSPMGMADMSMDTESTDDNVQNKTLKAMMNKPFFIMMTKGGLIENVEGTENLYSDFGSLGLDDATLNTVKQQFQQSMGNETQKASFANAIVNYSEKKVKVGATWTTVSTGLAMNFPTKTDNTMTLKSFDAAKAVVSIDGTIASTDKDKVVSLPNGIKSKLDVGGRQALTATIDVKSGWSTELKGVSEIKGTMTLLAGGMIPQDMLVPIEIVTESEYKMVKN